MRCRTVKIRYLDNDRLCAALEVRSNRRGKYSEHIIVGRLYSDNRINAHHVRPDIKSCSASVRRYNILISLDNLCDRIDKSSVGKSGHLKSCSGIVESLRI